MNKRELVVTLSDSADLGIIKSGDAVDAVFGIISNELVGKGKVSIPNFGVFSVVRSPARRMRNPRTGDTVEVAPSWRLKFKPSKALKDAVNNAEFDGVFQRE